MSYRPPHLTRCQRCGTDTSHVVCPICLWPVDRQAPRPKVYKVVDGVPVSKKLAKVYERDGGVCHLCGEPVAIRTATLDHVIPRSKGGGHSHLNLALAHYECNGLRRNLDVEEGRSYVRRVLRARRQLRQNTQP